MYEFSCEHCGGLVRGRVMGREVLRHKGGVVALEQVPIGVCEKCGARFFDAISTPRWCVALPRSAAARHNRIELLRSPWDDMEQSSPPASVPVIGPRSPSCV